MWRRQDSEGLYLAVLKLVVGNGEGAAKLFSAVPSDRARGNGH